jgi:hypothetical protein
MDFAVLINTSLPVNPNCPRSVILSETTTTIGRYGNVKMDTVKTHEISKCHAAIQFRDVRGRCSWYVEDKFSLNGTFLNSTKIKERILKSEDELVFGGGSCFLYGDTIVSTDPAECRYKFLIPEPRMVFATNFDRYETLASEEECDECCICFLPMLVRTRLPCNHIYCRRCIGNWARKCKSKGDRFVCPVCREEYSEDMAKPPCIRLFDGEYVVNNVECFLRRIDMKNICDVEDLALCKEWDDGKREKFWSAYEKLRNSNKKLMLFRYLTRCSYRAVKEASSEELEEMAKNLGCKEKLSGEVLVQYVLWLVASQLYGVVPSVTESRYSGDCSVK